MFGTMRKQKAQTLTKNPFSHLNLLSLNTSFEYFIKKEQLHLRAEWTVRIVREITQERVFKMYKLKDSIH